MPHCQTFKQKIEELKIKAQNIEALLSDYKKTADEEIAQRFERELDNILQEIEKFKQEFKTQATQIIEEFVQRRDNADEKVEIIFDEKDGRFIIDGDLNFSSRTHLDDFPNLIKEITGNFWFQKAKTINLLNLEKIGGFFYTEEAQTINLPNLKEVGGYFDAEEAQTINLPNLEKIGENFYAPNAQTINLPNIKEIGGSIYFNEDNSNLNSLVELARGWREEGILKGKIYKVTPEEEDIEVP